MPYSPSKILLAFLLGSCIYNNMQRESRSLRFSVSIIEIKLACIQSHRKVTHIFIAVNLSGGIRCKLTILEDSSLCSQLPETAGIIMENAMLIRGLEHNLTCSKCLTKFVYLRISHASQLSHHYHHLHSLLFQIHQKPSRNLTSFLSLEIQ